MSVNGFGAKRPLVKIAGRPSKKVLVTADEVSYTLRLLIDQSALEGMKPSKLAEMLEYKMFKFPTATDEKGATGDLVLQTREEVQRLANLLIRAEVVIGRHNLSNADLRKVLHVIMNGKFDKDN